MTTAPAGHAQPRATKRSGATREYDYEYERVRRLGVGSVDAGCVAIVRSAAERLGHSHMDIVADAGHDACWVNRVVPAAMIMCPCAGIVAG